MAKKKSSSERTLVVTAAQGMQNPYSAKMYGRDSSKGAPNIPLIKNIERYVADAGAELQIHTVVGANCNEVELHPYFETREDVYIEEDSKMRNDQNRVKEQAKRENWEERQGKWTIAQVKKAEKEKLAKLKKTYGKEWKEHLDEVGSFKVQSVVASDFPHNMPMHHFWETIPETDRPIIGERLNSNVRTESVPVKPQNKMPLNSKEFLTKEFGGNSVVIASPKRMQIPIAKGMSDDYPHLLFTTGACTHPNYNFGDLGFIAKKEHRYGFAVIDVLNEKEFLSRIVPAHKNGNCIDLGIKYSNGKAPERARVSLLDVGDSHFAEINPKINEVNFEMMRYLRPETTTLNDAFAALSVSVHDKNDSVRLARLHRAGLRNLEKELFLTGEYIARNANAVSEWDGDVVIKFSNHDDMLYRWLTSDSYRGDHENKLTAHKILAQDPDRGNCFEKAVRLFYDIPANVKFMRPEEDLFVQGYLITHGHQGVNGAKGTIKGIEKIAKKASIGHGHAPIVWKDSLATGTSTGPMDYQAGYFSTSMAGNNLIYETGLAQSVPIVKSKWAPKRVLDFLSKN